MYIALIIVHVVLCILLIVTILLQAGRGGGLTEMFGGETAQSVLGTQAPALLKKITEVSAIGFIVTSLALGMITARQGKSLFDGSALPYIPTEQGTALPFAPVAQEVQTAETAAELPPVEPIVLPGETVIPVDETELPAAVSEAESVNVLLETKVEEVAGTVEEAAVIPVGQDGTQKEGDR